jgi:tRNA U34 2-thiouridine synthase MnmA/TrmU
MSGRIRAIGLLSGGLDSTLATRVMMLQGVDVIAVNFYTGFCITGHRRRFAHDRGGSSYGRNEALRAGKDLRIEVRLVDVSDGYLDVLTHPRFGYGSAMNPCIDCRIYMLCKAKEMMGENNAAFVFTGEVLGQRPMSQHRPTLRLIEAESGLEGYLLRPLSARLLPETIPESEGWVDREKLYGFHGRMRRQQQMRLAEELGIVDYPQPAGGCCFLTDKNYARRLEDLFRHRGRERLTMDDVFILKAGRHFRLPNGAKLVVGRNQEENAFLEGYREGRCSLEVLGHPGPLALVEESITGEDLHLAAAMTAGYSDARREPAVEVAYSGCSVDGSPSSGSIRVAPVNPERSREWLI